MKQTDRKQQRNWHQHLVLGCLFLLFVRPCFAVDVEQLTMKAYNEEDYQLGYQAFVGSGALVDAWRVAKSAVQQRPDHLQWRQRLAELSEWIQKPQDAYNQWLYLYARNRQDKAANEALLRLAPALGDKQMALTMWLSRHGRAALTPTQLVEAMTLFEGTGQPEAGVRFFETVYQRSKDVNALAMSARLLMRMGQDERALGNYELLLTKHAFRTEWLVSAVTLQLRQKNASGALHLMQSFQDKVPASEYEFWALLGDIAWSQQQDKTTMLAYQQLAKHQTLTTIQRERFMLLLETYAPESVPDFAYFAYLKSKDGNDLIRTLGYLVQQQDWSKFAALLSALPNEQLNVLETKADFLLLRAQHFAHLKQPEKANSDITHAYRTGKQNPAIASQVLWFYIDQRDIPQVKDLLRTHTQQALTEPAFWAPFAAAYHELDDIPQAMAFYQKQLKANPNDALWMLNYADAVSRSGQTGSADRIRRQAWTILEKQKDKGQQPPLPLSRYPQLLAYANLTLQNLAGDGANKYMQRMVNRLRGLDNEKQDNQQTNDLILSWAINNNAIPAAKLWLMGRYGKHYKSQAPEWGETTVALQTNDTQTLARLNADSDALPPYDRHDIAQALEFEGQAAQIAFDNLRGNPTDNPMHERYVASYLRQANMAGLQVDAVQGDAQTRLGGIAYTSLRIAPHWHLGIEIANYGVKQDSDSVYSDRVERNNLYGLSVAYERSRYQWSLAARNHQLLENWWSGEGQVNYSMSSKLALSASMRYAMPNRDTSAMSLVGMEDVLQASATYAITVRDYVRLSTQLAQYRTQTDRYLGTGSHVDWEVGHRIRTEYPDWNIKLLGAHRRYTRDGSADVASLVVFKDPALSGLAGFRESSELLLPVDTDYFALCAGAGQNLSERRNLDGSSQFGRYYSKAWRPLGEVCATYNSAAATTGYSALAGVRGSIDGEDQMLLVYQESNGGLQLPNQTLRAISAKYERLF
jgi:hypothetical protein